MRRKNMWQPGRKTRKKSDEYKRGEGTGKRNLKNAAERGS